MATGESECDLSEDSFELNCTVCIKKQNIRQAVSFCHECKKYFCVKCIEIHNVFHDDHTVVECQGKDTIRKLLTEKCVRHEDKIIDLYCKDHDLLACSVCAVLEHRECKEIKHITESFNELDKDPRIQNIPDQLKSALQDVESIISKLDDCMEELLRGEAKILEQVEATAKRLVARIEEMKIRTKEDVKTQQQELTAKAIEKRGACSDMRTGISKCLEDMKISTSRKAHLFIMKKKGELLSESSKKLCKDSKDLTERCKLWFKTDQRVENCLNDFKSIGRGIKMYQGSMMGNIDVETAENRSDDDNCVHRYSYIISGCCLHHDGTILLTYHQTAYCTDYNTQGLANIISLTRVNTSTNTAVNHCTTKPELGQLTCISQQEVAVCTKRQTVENVKCTEDCTVEIYSIDSKLTHSMSIKMNHACNSVAYNKGELYVADNTCVYVYDLRGIKQIPQIQSGTTTIGQISQDQSGTQKIREISKNQSGTQMIRKFSNNRYRRMLSSIEGIALSSTGDTIYIADARKGLIATDLVGHELFRLPPTQLGIPNLRQVVTDQKGSVLVSGDNQVVQVTEDGQVLGKILSTDTGGLKDPKCICYSVDKNRLYVGGKSHKLRVYQLT